MAFTIHILGENPIMVNDAISAMYHLGAKYGATIYNAAVKQGYIVFAEDYVKVRPFSYKAVNPQINGLADGYELTPLDEEKSLTIS